MARGTQDVNAVRTWLDDWSKQMAVDGLTIASVTSVVADSPAVVGTTTHTTTGVLFQLTTAAVTPVPSDVEVVVTVVLSNGDTDVHRHTIGVTND